MPVDTTPGIPNPHIDKTYTDRLNQLDQKRRHTLTQYESTPKPTPAPPHPACHPLTDHQVEQLTQNKTFITETITAFTTTPTPQPALQFTSNEEAAYHLDCTAKTWAIAHNQPITTSQLIDVFRTANLAFSIQTFPSGHKQPWFYDYDQQLYTLNPQLPHQWITAIKGACNRIELDGFLTSVITLEPHAVPFQPLPQWCIPVGNGIYNACTGDLTPYHPGLVVTSRITTPYYPGATEPVLPGGITFQKLVNDLADHDPERAKLIIQMVKAIIFGSPTKAAFILRGPGGDGKSTFMQLIANIIGAQNVGHLNLHDMASEAKVLEVIGKRLVIGNDNKKDQQLDRLDLLKAAVQGETLTLDRKYLSAVSVPFTGTIVQLCNHLPLIKEDGAAIRRRLVTIDCRHSHYEHGTQIDHLSQTITNPQWHQHILAWLIEATDWWTDFTPIDEHLLGSRLDSQHPTGVFLRECHAQGLFSGPIDHIPKTLLYAMWTDWWTAHYPGEHCPTSRTFYAYADGWLADYAGFRQTTTDITITGLTRHYQSSQIDFTKWPGRYATQPNTKTCLAKANQSTTGWQRTATPTPPTPIHGKRTPRRCDSHTYLGVWTAFFPALTATPHQFADQLIKHGYATFLTPVNQPSRPTFTKTQPAPTTNLFASLQAFLTPPTPPAATTNEITRTTPNPDHLPAPLAALLDDPTLAKICEQFTAYGLAKPHTDSDINTIRAATNLITCYGPYIKTHLATTITSDHESPAYQKMKQTLTLPNPDNPIPDQARRIQTILTALTALTSPQQS